MADRHVEPGKTGWRVIKHGGTRASATTATRDEAIERARQIIAKDGGGELIVHADGGDIVRRETVDPAGRERAPRQEDSGQADEARQDPGPGLGQDREEPPRVQDEVEAKVLDAGRTASTTAKQWADKGWDVAKDVLGKVRNRIGC